MCAAETLLRNVREMDMLWYAPAPEEVQGQEDFPHFSNYVLKRCGWCNSSMYHH